MSTASPFALSGGGGGGGGGDPGAGAGGAADSGISVPYSAMEGRSGLIDERMCRRFGDGGAVVMVALSSMCNVFVWLFTT